MATNKPETSGPAFGRSDKPYVPGKDAPKTTGVSLPNIPQKPTALAEPDLMATDDGSDAEVHPEHIAGKLAVKHFEAKTSAEIAAGEKALERHPHRHK